ncbi:MAG: AAA family ATPase, partial [Acidobacteriota bacterium]
GEGAVLILDEWDCMNPSVGMVLQSVLEGSPLTVTETGEVIRPHADFRLFATSNTTGQGDETGLYNGTTPQNFASLDRFTMVAEVGYPDAETEKEIIRKKTGCENGVVLERLTRCAAMVREGFLSEQTRATMSTRTVVNVASKLLTFGDVLFAYSIGYLNKLAPEDRKFCREAVQRVWGV